MTNFKPGDKVKERLSGQTGVVGPRGCYNSECGYYNYLDIAWDFPSKRWNGGYYAEAFELLYPDINLVVGKKYKDASDQVYTAINTVATNVFVCLRDDGILHYHDNHGRRMNNKGEKVSENSGQHFVGEYIPPKKASPAYVGVYKHRLDGAIYLDCLSTYRDFVKGSDKYRELLDVMELNWEEKV